MDTIVCLPDTGRHNRGNADSMYLTQLGENQELVTTVFPKEGEVNAWLSRPGLWPTSNWGVRIQRAERGAGARTINERLHELGFNKGGTIGVAGLTSTLTAYVRQQEGLANWQSVEMIKSNFPKAKVNVGWVWKYLSPPGTTIFSKFSKQRCLIHRNRRALGRLRRTNRPVFFLRKCARRI